jgi:tetratricopeptide (TPR) repeat protein
LRARGVTYLALKRIDEALRDFTLAISLRPFYAPPYNTRGLAYLELQKFDRAVSDFTEAIRCDPRDASFYDNRAQAEDKQGAAKAASADRHKAAELRTK